MARGKENLTGPWEISCWRGRRRQGVHWPFGEPVTRARGLRIRWCLFCPRDSGGVSLRPNKCVLCADPVLCNGDSVVSKTGKVPVLMELTFWWRKTDRTHRNKQDNFR